MGVSRVGLWTVGSVSVRTAPLVRGLRDVLVFLRFVLVLGPIRPWLFAIVVFLLFLLIHVFLYAGTGFFISPIFISLIFR